MLDCNGVWFEKPVDRDHARASLMALAGREHRLVTSAVVARGGSRIWHNVQTVRMRMRPMSESFLDAHPDAVGAEVCASVRSYQLERLGAQLFTDADGTYIPVLGTPLCPLPDF